jgi:hypothetical protein
LNDTCADCDPEVRLKILKPEYEKRYETIMQKIRIQRAEGTDARVAELRALIIRDPATFNRTVDEMDRMRNSHGTVRYTGVDYPEFSDDAPLFFAH